MSCDCMTNFDAKLAEHNTRMVVTFGFPRDGSPAYVRPRIDTEKIEPRKRLGPVIALPTFCPFCGQRYDTSGAGNIDISRWSDFANWVQREIDLRMIDLSITQRDLADRLGLSEARISQILSAGANPTLDTLAKIFAALEDAATVADDANLHSPDAVSAAGDAAPAAGDATAARSTTTGCGEAVGVAPSTASGSPHAEKSQ